jgi:hypothetical protein
MKTMDLSKPYKPERRGKVHEWWKYFIESWKKNPIQMAFFIIVGIIISPFLVFIYVSDRITDSDE